MTALHPRPLLVLVALLAVAAFPLACNGTEGAGPEAPLDEPLVPPLPTAEPSEGDSPDVTAPTDPGGERAVLELRIAEVDGAEVHGAEVHGAEVDGVEGFEVGLRIEGADERVLERLRWSDLVAAQDPTAPVGPHELVHEQVVPTGTVVVLAEVALGVGPPPSVPDLDAELPCRAELDLDADDRAVVEVLLDRSEDCLRPV